MKSLPTADPRILEALEACRPGSEDLQDPAMEPLRRQMGLFPELADLYSRLQRTDRAVAEALARVPVPEGLADRVLGRLASSPSPCEPGHTPAARTIPRKWRRRAWLVAAGTMAIAASVVLVVLLNSPKLPSLSAEQALGDAIAFFNADTRTGGTLLGIEPQPPASYALSQALPTRGSQVQWRWVDGLLDGRSVAYDIVAPSGVSATVYVIRRPLSGLGDFPPGTPMLATGGARPRHGRRGTGCSYWWSPGNRGTTSGSSRTLPAAR